MRRCINVLSLKREKQNARMICIKKGLKTVKDKNEPGEFEVDLATAVAVKRAQQTGLYIIENTDKQREAIVFDSGKEQVVLGSYDFYKTHKDNYAPGDWFIKLCAGEINLASVDETTKTCITVVRDAILREVVKDPEVLKYIPACIFKKVEKIGFSKLIIDAYEEETLRKLDSLTSSSEIEKLVANTQKNLAWMKKHIADMQEQIAAADKVLVKKKSSIAIDDTEVENENQ